jgi:lipopolysaccharide transport system ATP-binding protein
MPETAIHAVGLSKTFELRSSVAGHLDALKDVSFDIHVGEAVGLIGRNGAGKSTLLRLLSRVTRPSSGYADIVGRIGALLEVGVGFHPDLTGRENTFLSGALLGLKRREIEAKFDEIVNFAEIEAFIDEPVKHYSSGMFARLGFSVASHLRPEILIVDEVLAVGDLPFQAKCLALMRGLTSEGTTVLFVSHNLLGLSDLCPRALVLSSGIITFDGPSTEAVIAYKRSLDKPVGQPADGVRPPYQMSINGEHIVGGISSAPNDELSILLSFEEHGVSADEPVEVNLVIEAPDGRRLAHLRNDLAGERLILRSGQNQYGVYIEDIALAPGDYYLWFRIVSFDRKRPRLWDTDRVHLAVIGDRRRGEMLQPRHRFSQYPGSHRISS